PLVAAHDTYYLKKEDSLAREMVNKIRTGGTLDREFGVNASDFSFISKETAGKYFADFPEALENIGKIVDSCNVELELGKWVFPDIKVAGATHDEALRELAYKGFAMRELEETPELRQRLDYELGVIAKKGYSPYFLVVSD